MTKRIDLLEPFRKTARKRGALSVTVRGSAVVDLRPEVTTDVAAELLAEQAREEWRANALKDKRGGRMAVESGRTWRSIKAKGSRIMVSLPAKRVSWFPLIKRIAPSLFAHDVRKFNRVLGVVAKGVVGQRAGDKLGAMMRGMR